MVLVISRDIQVKDRAVPDLKIAATDETGSVDNFIKRFIVSEVF